MCLLHLFSGKTQDTNSNKVRPTVYSFQMARLCFEMGVELKSEFFFYLTGEIEVISDDIDEMYVQIRSS